MALEDIEKRIIGDAEKEAAQIVSHAQKTQQGKILQAEKAVKKQREELQEMLRMKTLREVEQHKQLQKMDAAQRLLSAKRDSLEELLREVSKDIISDPEQTEAFFIRVLQQSLPEKGVVRLEVAAAQEKSLKHVLKKLDRSADVVPQKDWAEGKLEVVLDRARIDCSLALYIHEQSRLFEARVASSLFAGA